MKNLLTMCLLITIIFLTGCEQNSSNRLVCSYTDKEIKDLTSETKYVFLFNEEEETIKSATMTTKVTLKGDYNSKAFINNYTVMASTSASDYNLTEGVTANVTNKKNVVTLKVEMDPTKMDDENIEYYGLNLKKEDLKGELEAAGYTCK